MRAYLGLGSNLGDRTALLDAAIDAFQRRGVQVVARSRVYETSPVGGPAQPDYLNQVVAVEWEGDARSLLRACNDVEAELGRDRSKEVRWGPRPIDVDILLIEGVTIDEPDLVVPHLRLAERAFALVPLAEIAPGLEIPGVGTVEQALARMPEEAAAVRAPML